MVVELRGIISINHIAILPLFDDLIALSINLESIIRVIYDSQTSGPEPDVTIRET